MSRLLRALAGALSLALVAGCGSDPPPSAPAASPSDPAIREVTPPARATAVLYDSNIQVEFVPAIDPASLDSTTVYMKLDLARQPVTLQYDAASHVLRIIPRFALLLRRTYTIEITPRVRTTSGTPAVPGGTFWQFTTNSVRRPTAAYPVDGITMESPYVRLGWASTEASAGTINYDLFVSDDSLALAAGAVTRLVRRAKPYHIPSTRWGFDRKLYWSVTASNLTTGETLNGPIARFTTLPASTPIDSATAPMDRWGYYRRQTRQAFCNPASIPTSETGDFSGALRWKFPASAQPWRLANAYVRFGVNTFNWAPRRPAARLTRDLWSDCASLGPLNPQGDAASELAVGVPGGGPDLVLFQSESLTAYLESCARFEDTVAFQLASSQLLTYSTAEPNNIFRGAVRFYFYKLPPPGAATATQ